MSEATRVVAVLFESNAPEALARFYAQAFGFAEPKHSGTDHLGMRTGNTYLGFDRIGSANADLRQPSRVSVWFGVADVEQEYHRLLGLGARPKDVPDAKSSPGEVLAQLYDPEGNVIGLIGPDIAERG